MTNTIDQAFITQWTDRVHQVFQQKGSRLKDRVRVEYTNANVAEFHKLGTSTVSESEFGDLPSFDNPAHTTPSATMTDRFAEDLVRKLDQKKTNVSWANQYQESHGKALGRYVDSTIIAAMNDATPTATVTAGSGLTLTDVIQGRIELMKNDIFGDATSDDLTFVLTSEALSDALGVTEFQSSDYMTMKSLVDGTIDTAVGFKWVPINTLTKSGSPEVHQCYVFHRDAIGLGINNEIETEISYSQEFKGWLITSYVSCGAVVIDPTGLVQIDVTVS